MHAPFSLERHVGLSCQLVRDMRKVAYKFNMKPSRAHAAMTYYTPSRAFVEEFAPQPSLGEL